MRLLLTADPEIEVPPLLYGGIERIVDVLVRRLRAAGHTVGLVARPGSECPNDAFFPWAGLSSLSRRDTVLNTLALARAVRAFGPDVVHSFSRIAYLLPHLRGRIPLIMSFQREPTHRTVGLAVRLSAPGRLTFTGCSEYIARRGRPAGGEWHGIPNFADTEGLTLGSPSVPDDAPLVFLSRVEEIKGAHWAIEIARRTGRRLIIAGNHSERDDPEGRFWAERIAPEIGKGGIEYVGPVDDVQKNALLGRARAMVVPIQWDEPFGIVFAESLACGAPVVSCPRGALPEIVRPGVDGFLIDSVEAGCEAVERVGALDRTECRRRAVERFSADAVVARYVDLYSKVRGGMARS
jgi:glycosyltransferase involved in cell wall biosynthesis